MERLFSSDCIRLISTFTIFYTQIQNEKHVILKHKMVIGVGETEMKLMGSHNIMRRRIYDE